MSEIPVSSYDLIPMFYFLPVYLFHLALQSAYQTPINLSHMLTLRQVIAIVQIPN